MSVAATPSSSPPPPLPSPPSASSAHAAGPRSANPADNAQRHAAPASADEHKQRDFNSLVNFSRNWLRWGARWGKHGLIVAVQHIRHPVRRTRFLRPRIGNLAQHSPRRMQIPRWYSQTAAPANPPRISIVTPSFNQAHLIERTIRSVFDQNYSNLEYIVQDGASRDGTSRVLARFADRLNHWESVPDNGQTDAINRGFRHATGEIMAYLNSDDLLLPGALNAVARHFTEHPEIDAVYGHRVLIDEQDREIGRWILPEHDNAVLNWADYIPQETLFWRRSAWDRVGGRFDESFHFAMDWDFLLRLRDAGVRFARLPRFLGAFRVHDKQKTTAAISDLGVKEMARLRERQVGYVPEAAEVHVNCSRYLLRHLACHAMYRAGLTRY